MRLRVKCRHCGTDCFPARRNNGQHALVEFNQKETGRWIANETASGTLAMFDAGQPIAGGYELHFCEKMRALMEALRLKRPKPL